MKNNWLLTALMIASCAAPPPEPEAAAEPEPVAQAPVEAVKPEPPVEAAEKHYTPEPEVYDRTFEEIQKLVDELNSIISKRQFNKWLTYVSGEYARLYNSPEQLAIINQSPQLKDNGIVLRSIRDYFQWVVVPSRSSAVLDEIVFLNERQVIAYSSYEGQRATLYELEQDEASTDELRIWKIAVLEKAADADQS